MSARYPSLEGAPVVVTGGGQGIGAAAVRQFAEQGARVGLIDVSAEHAEAIAAETGAAAEIVDLRDVEALRSAVGRLAERHGAARALINNAGDDDRCALPDLTPEIWDDRHAVNLRHMAFAAQAVAPGMAAAGGGSVVNMGSISWMMGAAGLPAYTSAKAAVGGLTKSLARELGPERIRVNCVAPGWVQTERQIRLRTEPGKREAYLARQCLKALLEPEDVARLMLWLAAEDSRMVTGQTFVVDGGVV